MGYDAEKSGARNYTVSNSSTVNAVLNLLLEGLERLAKWQDSLPNGTPREDIRDSLLSAEVFAKDGKFDLIQTALARAEKMSDRYNVPLPQNYYDKKREMYAEALNSTLQRIMLSAAEGTVDKVTADAADAEKFAREVGLTVDSLIEGQLNFGLSCRLSSALETVALALKKRPFTMSYSYTPEWRIGQIYLANRHIYEAERIITNRNLKTAQAELEKTKAEVYGKAIPYLVAEATSALGKNNIQEASEFIRAARRFSSKCKLPADAEIVRIEDRIKEKIAKMEETKADDDLRRWDLEEPMYPEYPEGY